MNYRLISRINDLEHSINVQSSDYSYLAHQISDQTYHLENTIREILQEQSWIDAIKFDLDLQNRDKGEAILKFQWLVNEYPEGAEVAFHYTFSGDDSYMTVSPENVGNGMFQISIPLTMDLGPNWEVVHFFDRDTGSSGLTHNTEEVPEYEYLQPNISYYVSIDHDDLLKSSPLQTDYLNNYGVQLYGSLHSVITVSDTEVVYLDITHHPGERMNQVKEMSLIKYEDERVLGEELLNHDFYEGENDQYQPNYFSFNEPIKLDSFSHIVAKVIFEDGKIFEKEIYRK